jgi:hypothetical protein
MATTHTEFGRFIQHYRKLDKAGLLHTTPVILSEGDSWFSTPLYYNLVDWLEVASHDALFMRLESSGAQATEIFDGGSLRKLRDRLKAFQFDLLLISAGGNDFVDKFLRDTFRNAKPMTPEAALQRVIDTGRYDEVLRAYRRMLDAAYKARPDLYVITHTYDCPRLMGQEGKLTVAQLGLAALFKRSVGDWIAKHVRKALETEDEQRTFARLLMDQYSDSVLAELKKTYGTALTVVDFRGKLTDDADWNDEMHPTEDAFKRLAVDLRVAVRDALPPLKLAGFG